MWILLYRLRCSRNSVLPYFHKIKLNFILRSYSTRLIEIQFLSLLRSSPAHAKLSREHSGRSHPEVTTHASEFPLVHTQWVLNPVSQVAPGAHVLPPRVIHMVSAHIPSPGPSCHLLEVWRWSWPQVSLHSEPRPPSPLTPLSHFSTQSPLRYINVM